MKTYFKLMIAFGILGLFVACNNKSTQSVSVKPIKKKKDQLIGMWMIDSFSFDDVKSDFTHDDERTGFHFRDKNVFSFVTRTKRFEKDSVVGSWEHTTDSLIVTEKPRNLEMKYHFIIVGKTLKMTGTAVKGSQSKSNPTFFLSKS